MRNSIFIIVTALTILPAAGMAQTASETIGHPPPIPSPPPLPAPPPLSPPPTATKAAPTTSTTAAPPSTDIRPNQTPYLPESQVGLDKVAGDGVTTKTVKAVPCSTFARETDGSTTCVGIQPERKRR